MQPFTQFLVLMALLSLVYGFVLGLAVVFGFGRGARRSAGPAAGAADEHLARPSETDSGGPSMLPPHDFIEYNFALGDRDTITGERFEIGDPVAQCASCYAVYSAFGRALIAENNGDRCVRCAGTSYWRTSFLESFTGQPRRQATVPGEAARPHTTATASRDGTINGADATGNTGTPAPARPRRRLRGRMLRAAAVFAAVLGGVALYLNHGTPSLAEISEIVGRPTVEVRRVDGALLFGEQVYPVPVEIADMPEFLKTAIVEIEDRRFYYHPGIDPVGIVVAFATFAYDTLTGSPARLRGGSTITQQVAKNVFLTADWSFLRKARESWLALKLSAVLSKDEVLQLYLNRIFMGGANYGIELAARDYFGVRAKSLNKYQVAILAGIISRPNRASPRRSASAAHERARIVLDTLVRRGRLEAAEHDRLMRRWHGASFAALQTGTRSVPRIDRGWIEDWLRRELADAGYLSEAPVRLVLSIDPLAQIYAELAASRLADHGRKVGGYDSLAIVVLSPDGAIRALVGGADRRVNQFNNAILARRPMASTFKPIVFLDALRRGMTSESIVSDRPIEFDGEAYPRNFGGAYQGEVTVAEAIRMSLNAAAVRLCDTAPERRSVVDLARRLGLEGPFPDAPSLALGTVAATPIEVASVYAALANDGYPASPFAVAAAQHLNGRVTYRVDNGQRRTVVARRHVRAMNRMLNRAATSGTGRASAFSRNVAGKTGTSQDSRDAWFAGYTGDLVAVIWVGNRDNRRTSEVTGGGIPANAFGNLMANIYDGKSPPAPPGVR